MTDFLVNNFVILFIWCR